MKILLRVLPAIIFSVSVSNAQNSFKSKKNELVPLTYFLGKWDGEGQFANGKKISANASFEFSLDSSWIIYIHHDKLPNHYKSISMWSIDSLNQKVNSSIFDNHHGHREFNGTQDSTGKFIFNHYDLFEDKSKFYQRFLYTIIDRTHFKMTYEVSSDGSFWKFKDSLIFIKNEMTGTTYNSY